MLSIKIVFKPKKKNKVTEEKPRNGKYASWGQRLACDCSRTKYIKWTANKEYPQHNKEIPAPVAARSKA